MRRRITTAFFAAAAAGATVTTLGLAASPAGAMTKYYAPSGGTPIGTAADCGVSDPPQPSDGCAMVGYEATGRDFRFAQAMITVPDHNAIDDPDSSTTEPDSEYYVALDNSSSDTYEFARVGIAPCPSGKTEVLVPDGTPAACPTIDNPTGWVTFAAVQQPTGEPTVDVNGLATNEEGDGILVNAYLEPTGNAVHFTVTLPADGGTINNVIPVAGPVYTRAMAVADWTSSVINGGFDDPPMPDVPPAKVRDSQFQDGRFTTMSGAAGTFNGPWKVNAFEATSNGDLVPNGALIGAPSYLWNDGNGLNGMGDDAFGIWRYPF